VKLFNRVDRSMERFEHASPKRSNFTRPIAAQSSYPTARHCVPACDPLHGTDSSTGRSHSTMPRSEYRGGVVGLATARPWW